MTQLDRVRAVGLNEQGQAVLEDRDKTQRYLALKLAALGIEIADSESLEEAKPLLHTYREQQRLLRDHLPPVDQRIQDFLDKMLDGCSVNPRLPSHNLELDRHGLARELSLPRKADYFKSDIIESFRLSNGVLHNPKNDRRTTKGVFHIADVGLPIPADKKAVPAETYARMLDVALNSMPEDIGQLPYLAADGKHRPLFCTQLMRPLLAPEVPGVQPEKRIESRFFAGQHGRQSRLRWLNLWQCR